MKRGFPLRGSYIKKKSITKYIFLKHISSHITTQPIKNAAKVKNNGPTKISEKKYMKLILKLIFKEKNQNYNNR